MAEVIQDEVARAIKLVEGSPRHARGSAVATGEPVWLVNVPLEEGFRAIVAILRRHDGVCDCWNCRCDMVALALRHYPARYGVEHAGYIHLFEEDLGRMRDELSLLLDRAVTVIATAPHHDLSPA